MKQAYITKKFKPASLALIEQSNTILEDLTRRGFSITLRQLYYQLVSKDVIPNKQTEYDKLQSLVNDARMAGLMDWAHIVDRTRYLRRDWHPSEPKSYIEAAAAGYTLDKWQNQDYWLEFWVEKDALIDIVGQICQEHDVAHFSCRGFTSVSEMRVAGRRLRDRYRWHHQTPVVFHLGDHDPSGIDMSRDIEERLRLFMEESDHALEFERIALNMDQVEEYEPPPNPAKTTDSRYESYSRQYGVESWELDALDPDVITSLIEGKILEYRDDDKHEKILEREQRERDLIVLVAKEYPRIAKLEAAKLEPPERQLSDSRLWRCPHCNSTEHGELLDCSSCDGSGLWGSQTPGANTEKCEDCNGRGKTYVCGNCYREFPAFDAAEDEEE